MRKMHLAVRATAAVAFPGGFGTLAELFEVLTLVQTRKGRSIPIVCVDRDYWTRAINFDLLLEAQVISPADFQLLRFAEDAEGAWQELAAPGIQTANARPILRASDEGIGPWVMPSGTGAAEMGDGCVASSRADRRPQGSP